MALIRVSSALGLDVSPGGRRRRSRRFAPGKARLPCRPGTRGPRTRSPHFPVLGADRAWYPYSGALRAGKREPEGNVADPQSGKRVSGLRRAAGSGRAPLQLPRQAERIRDVSRQPLDQEGDDRSARRLGGARRGTQFPRRTQPADGFAGGFPNCPDRGCGELWVGATDRVTGMRWRVEFTLDRGSRGAAADRCAWRTRPRCGTDTTGGQMPA